MWHLCLFVNLVNLMFPLYPLSVLPQRQAPATVPVKVAMSSAFLQLL
jgi:hypothetical protein